MKVEINNCVVTAEYEYDKDDYNGMRHYFLRVQIPLPGGSAGYSFPITKAHYESLEFAKKLSEKA
jgi:hypothetical protein